MANKATNLYRLKEKNGRIIRLYEGTYYRFNNAYRSYPPALVAEYGDKLEPHPDNPDPKEIASLSRAEAPKGETPTKNADDIPFKPKEAKSPKKELK